MKKELRISSYNDYIAVDWVDETVEGKPVIETLLYLSKDKPVELLTYDEQDKRWYKSSLTFDGTKINAVDIDKTSSCEGLKFELSPDDLLDARQVRLPEPKKVNNIAYNNGLVWKVNTAAMLQEMIANSQTAIFTKPVQIFGGILHELAERCSQLNDPVLNGIMCRLALYEIADPFQKGYNSKLANKLIREGLNYKA